MIMTVTVVIANIDLIFLLVTIMQIPSFHIPCAWSTALEYTPTRPTLSQLAEFKM